jgi:hypothetical protein
VPLTVTNVDPAPPTAAELEITLQGVTRLPDLTPDHQVTVLLNGVELGVLAFDGRVSGSARFAVPPGLLREGGNTVRLAAQGAVDYSLIDVIRLSYWHTYRADADRLRFPAEGGQVVTLGGFASRAMRVVDVTDPEAVTELRGTVEPEEGIYWTTTMRLPGFGRRTLFAFTEATVGTPAFVTANRPSTWHAASKAHDYLVITHETFTKALAPLVTLRSRQGYGAALVDIADIYDEFSFGQKTPQALKDFVTYARTGWRRAPRYLVLAGDATIDPRDYAGFGDADFVPTKLVPMDTVELESATDDWFADLDEDGLPELAVGRLPMRSVAHAAAMVAKLVNYDAAPAGAWTKQVVLLSDEDDPTWSFAADSAQLKVLLPAGYTAHEVRAGAGVAAARGVLFPLVEQGQVLVNYIGHGSTYVWGKHATLLTSTDVTGPWAPGVGLPVVVAMNCLNGLFHSIWGEESLAETFVRAPAGGAVAAWASSSITHAGSQAVANRAFFRLLFEGLAATVGEAVAGAKQAVADRDVRRSWIFFGDPALRLKGVRPAAQSTGVEAAVPLRASREALVDPARAAEEAPSAPAEDGVPLAVEEATPLHLADFDGDARADVFLYQPETGLWTLARTEPHDFRYTAGQWAPGLELQAAQLSDDRLADVFGYDTTTGAWVQALNRGDGTFTLQRGTWAPGWHVRVGDLSGDGRDDVFAYNPRSGLWMQGVTDGVGTFSYRGGRGLPAGRVHLADFNRDARADLFIYDRERGHWVGALNDRAGGFTAAGGAAEPGWTVHVANLDANGAADLVFFAPASGAWAAWWTDPSGRVTTDAGLWTAGGQVHAGDLTGDGHDDLLWYEPASGQWVSHLSRGQGQFIDRAGVWASGASVAAGDLDGDRRGDAFLYNPATGQWWRQLSDGHGGFSETSGSWSIGWTLVGR